MPSSNACRTTQARGNFRALLSLSLRRVHATILVACLGMSGEGVKYYRTLAHLIVATALGTSDSNTTVSVRYPSASCGCPKRVRASVAVDVTVRARGKARAQVRSGQVLLHSRTTRHSRISSTAHSSHRISTHLAPWLPSESELLGSLVPPPAAGKALHNGRRRANGLTSRDDGLAQRATDPTRARGARRSRAQLLHLQRRQRPAREQRRPTRCVRSVCGLWEPTSVANASRKCVTTIPWAHAHHRLPFAQLNLTATAFETGAPNLGASIYTTGLSRGSDLLTLDLTKQKMSSGVRALSSYPHRTSWFRPPDRHPASSPLAGSALARRSTSRSRSTGSRSSSRRRSRSTSLSLGARR